MQPSVYVPEEHISFENQLGHRSQFFPIVAELNASHAQPNSDSSMVFSVIGKSPAGFTPVNRQYRTRETRVVKKPGCSVH